MGMRSVLLGSVGVLVLSAVVIGGSAAHGSPAGTTVAAKAPAATKGELIGVAAVPHSSDVWVIGSAGTLDNAKFFVARRHHGHWQKVKTPNLHGRCGSIDTIVAASAKSVWLGGAKQVSCHTGSIAQTAPAIWQLKGKKFVAQKLPKLSNLSDSVDSVSASSPNDVWAVGGLYPGQTTAQVAFHWNGKKWSAVSVPSGYSQNLYDVSASSPNNAWALRSDYAANQDVFVHWNGKIWTAGDAAPTGFSLGAVATSSAKLAYATGYSNAGSPEKSIILKYNGKTWSKVALPKVGVRSQLDAIAMHGKSVWAIGEGDKGRPVLLHSTGGAWKAENSPGKGYQLLSVSAGSATHAYAVGDHSTPASNIPTKTFFDAFAGHAWKGEPSKF
jgi:hypothetical protein